MRGVKGERKAFGLKSPLDGLLENVDLDYKGTRIGRDTKKPWIMYETDRGVVVDHADLDASLQKLGYVQRPDMDGNPVQYPTEGVPGRGQRYAQHLYEKRAKDGIVSEVLYLTTRFYDAGKGKKDFTSFEQIYY